MFRGPGCLRPGWGQSTPETLEPKASFQMAVIQLLRIFISRRLVESNPDTREWQVQLGKKENTNYSDSIWYLLVSFHVPGIVVLTPCDSQWRWEQVLPRSTHEGTEAQRGEFPHEDHTAISDGAGLRLHLTPEPALNHTLWCLYHSPFAAKREF